MKTKMKTKDRYLLESLKLFAERGYDGVSVMDIADAMGVSTPALYKHFPNKQALFDALLEQSRQGYAGQMEKMMKNICTSGGRVKEFVEMSVEEQIHVVQNVFLYISEDEMPRLFRKFMTFEQFQKPELAEMLNRRYADDQFDAFEKLMQEFIDAGIYAEGSARAMAVQYASPLILSISILDREPGRKEWVLKMLEEHVRQFNRIYRIESRNNGAVG